LKHEENALILWESFKERLETSEFQQVFFDLSDLMDAVPNLDNMESPFTSLEIDNIIKELPNGKSLGPGGFNSNFMKACWQIIKSEFYDLCMDFFDHRINLQSINDSYIVLFPKHNNHERVNDYRSISLLNSSIKLITKLLANRLESVILKIIHQNQYGFIKSRTIQDCLAWAFEYCIYVISPRKN
jgi:hypothetical protein